jgi:ribosomal protein S18 acetylase RimI-like enzyme
MNPALVVRRAVVSDARALAEIHVRAWQWAYRGLLPENFLDSLGATVERRETWRQEMLARDESEERTWVAEWSNQIVGFADTGPSRGDPTDPRTGELYAIYLEECFAGMGLGRALLRHAIDDPRDRGYRAATLWVLGSNARARRFYEAAGRNLDGPERIQELRGVTLRELRYFTELEER